MLPNYPHRTPPRRERPVCRSASASGAVCPLERCSRTPTPFARSPRRERPCVVPPAPRAPSMPLNDAPESPTPYLPRRERPCVVPPAPRAPSVPFNYAPTHPIRRPVPRHPVGGDLRSPAGAPGAVCALQQCPESPQCVGPPLVTPEQPPTSGRALPLHPHTRLRHWLRLANHTQLPPTD
jgi:hypothetical protein